MTESNGSKMENCIICREPRDYTGKPGVALRYYAKAVGPRGLFTAGGVRFIRRFGGPEIEDADCLTALSKLKKYLQNNGWHEIRVNESPLRDDPDIHPAFASAFQRANQ